MEDVWTDQRKLPITKTNLVEDNVRTHFMTATGERIDVHVPPGFDMTRTFGQMAEFSSTMASGALSTRDMLDVGFYGTMMMKPANWNWNWNWKATLDLTASSADVASIVDRSRTQISLQARSNIMVHLAYTTMRKMVYSAMSINIVLKSRNYMSVSMMGVSRMIGPLSRPNDLTLSSILTAIAKVNSNVHQAALDAKKHGYVKSKRVLAFLHSDHLREQCGRDTCPRRPATVGTVGCAPRTGRRGRCRACCRLVGRCYGHDECREGMCPSLIDSIDMTTAEVLSFSVYVIMFMSVTSTVSVCDVDGRGFRTLSRATDDVTYSISMAIGNIRTFSEV
eukprot:gene24328-9934_t